MTIGIVLHPFGEEKPGGLARTIYEWTRALIESDPGNTYVIFTKNTPTHPPSFAGTNWCLEPLGGGLWWKERIARTPLDLCLFQTPVLPLRLPPKPVIIAQDYPYHYLPAHSLAEWAQLTLTRWYHGWSLGRAAHVVAVSLSSKEDTMRFFGVPSEKISVVHMGYKDVCAVEPVAVERLPERFFLFVGVVKERKNFLRILEAYASFRRLHPELPHKLVVAGKTGNRYYEECLAYARSRGISDSIVLLEYLNDAQLSYVYRRAEALVFPSIVESFGFPVLEAMACGVPVITTKFQGPGEIARDAGLLVDPTNAGEIAEAMGKIASDPQLAEVLREKGRVRSRAFSWHTAATKLLRVISSV